MYHDEESKGKCPKCDATDFYCKCADMCHHCTYYKNHTCSNKQSGNHGLTLPYDAFCGKFTKKYPLIKPNKSNPFW